MTYIRIHEYHVLFLANFICQKESVIRVSASLLLCFVHHKLMSRIVFPFLQSSHGAFSSPVQNFIFLFRSEDSEFVDFDYRSFLSFCKVAQMHAYLLVLSLDVHCWYLVFHLLMHLGWSNNLVISTVLYHFMLCKPVLWLDPFHIFWHFCWFFNMIG